MLDKNREAARMPPPKPHWSTARKGKMLRKVIDGKMACKACKQFFPLLDFYVHHDKRRDLKRYHSDCDTCRKGKQIARLRCMSFADYKAMMAKSDGRCEICRETRAKLVIDHCHATERVRGILCVRCNSALGMIRDNPVIALAIAEYLKKHQEIEAKR